ncbi:glucosamine--fructose-6-phosphate aminotransferase (isomerizing) [Hamadaea flava]|uniref:Glutamine--fructose-6-phosphate aminotransferase [isomerizing] n=1 Tax=Hamadaea flava TaxID=1742688 RepID=A0ABV8LVM1_9ACTN|nr:sugar isomerase [Hamadaea flava]MCP2329138.1 glucosamine--fructose-6-phosphate aminotransferase (isomerizing) [Hamadaea flava]
MTRISYAEGRAAQPEALDRIVGRLRGSLDLPPVRRPLFCGIGASYAALAVPVEALRRYGVPAYRVLASEVAEYPAAFDADVLIAASQGGKSSETIAAFEQTRAATVAVVNVGDSPLAVLAEHLVGLGDEPDSYASTVGFTGTIVALDLIAAAVAGDPAAAKKWDGIGELVRSVGRIPDVASFVAADVVGSGASRASAEEAALLLREVPRVPAAASATRNYLHGEMESAGGTLHLIFGADREVELARTLAGAGHQTVLVTTAAVDSDGKLSVVRLPDVDPAVRVVLETVVAQELVAVLAEQRGVVPEQFVFANHDTKLGGVDRSDFEAAS